MKATIKTLLVMCTLIVVIITSCKKEAGPTGPKGDPGTNGSQGTSGINGTNGTNGTNGVANISSWTLTTVPSNWVHQGTAGSPGDSYMATFSVPALTTTVINSGAVLLYFVAGTTITQMPVTFAIYQNVASSYYYDAAPGMIRVYTADNDFYTVQPTFNLDFKLVIIPPAMRKPNVNYKNFDEVKKAHNLQD
jgi:hypothetical protein